MSGRRKRRPYSAKFDECARACRRGGACPSRLRSCSPAYGSVKLAAATLRAASVTRTSRNAPFHFGSSLIR